MVRVIVCNLPSSVKGLTKKAVDEYIILINDNCDEPTRWETLMHELSHIKLKHHDRKDTDRCEMEVMYETP